MIKQQIFNIIAETLLSDYISLYYVSADTGEYQWFDVDPVNRSLKPQKSGKDFLKMLKEDIETNAHPSDKDELLAYFKEDSLMRKVKDGDSEEIVYRVNNGGSYVYHQIRIIKGSGGDEEYFIVGVSDVDKKVKKEKKQDRVLKNAMEMARRDDLTGIGNKNAYQEFEKLLQKKMDSGAEVSKFALVIFDLNNLKPVNDTYGHNVGDEYLKASCKMICDTFAHSPVFRIGGDEFLACLEKRDYNSRHDLIKMLMLQVEDNMRRGNGPVIAIGMSEYDPHVDDSVSDVFKRADALMYDNKKTLKEQGGNGSSFMKYLSESSKVPPEKRWSLDNLFTAFENMAEGCYVFLCNMKYDYSRWSKECVDTFGLPGEYMFGAGDIWEEHIHPDDVENYRKSVADIFAGKSRVHDMQYRARRADGEYVMCTCKGMVILDLAEEPLYFCGTIMNNSASSNIDSITGLKNQYGFLEDIRLNLQNKNRMRIAMIGFSKFSEINEMYGYHFGNKVIQHFARSLYDRVENTGSVYRLDGTKLAVISRVRNIDEIKKRYKEFRSSFRRGVKIDGNTIVCEMNAGIIEVNDFELNDRAVFSCLDFAYEESKQKRQGDMVEFYDALNENNRDRIAKLGEIRWAIANNYKGFYLMYQPVVNAKTEKITGVEALIRYRSKKFGMVAPDDFIPIIERDPLYRDLGRWILKTALTDGKTMFADDPKAYVSVNLSYSQIERPDFIDSVREILKEVNYPPERLCLELTERCRLVDMQLLKNVIVNLRGMGIRVALDDFGTGFSSVGLLMDLEFDIIKIDRSFVINIENDSKQRTMMKHFSELAASFDANVCVEGLETEAMKEILKGYNVHTFQGYYYSKPLVLEDLLAWKKEQKG
ncbi:MAG: EAL domain-containing protein [Lachnospiraceae bacterium]|nr:EAL domain-containing protein [Lachnospiraceae bacterium]